MLELTPIFLYDDNAAGHTWFIDPTPSLNEEWLPTSNPNEWVAKIGRGEGAVGELGVGCYCVLGYQGAVVRHDVDATVTGAAQAAEEGKTETAQGD